MEEMGDLLDWESSDIFGTDIGDVLSKKGFNVWDPHWWTADPGAVAFMVFFRVRYGTKKVKVISRVKNIRKSWVNGSGKECWHWVMQFLDVVGVSDLGVDWDDVYLVRNGPDKSHLPVTRCLKVYVDNSFENLYHIGMACPSCRLVQYNNNGSDTGKLTYSDFDKARSNFEEIADRCIVASSWYDIALMCKLPVSKQLWDIVLKASPPYHPWSMSILHMVECQYDRTLVPRPPPRYPGPKPPAATPGIYAGDDADQPGDNDDDAAADQQRPVPSSAEDLTPLR